MTSHWLRSRWTIAVAAAVFGLAAAGVGWYIAAQSHTSISRAPLPKPAGSETPSSNSTMSAGRNPAAAFKLPAGYSVHVFAEQLGSARDLVFTPGGVLLASNPGNGLVLALPDTNKDGVAEQIKVALRAGDNPHGLAFYGGKLYVAFTTSVTRYHWDEAALTATLDKELFTLPANTNHNKRTITFDSKGQMFVSVGSTCNVCRETDLRSATIMTADANGNNPRVYAAGLRNAPFMAINPTTSELWATEMGRDNLGDNLPPDEIVIVRPDQNYGWPLCYGNRVHDVNFDPGTGNPCAFTEPPIYQVPAHSAPLGLAFIGSSQFPSSQQGDLLVAYHGSWNRRVPDGYKIVRLNINDNSIAGSEDFMTGFIAGGVVQARPVDLVFNPAGDLFVSDDKTGSVYIVQKKS